MVSGNPLKVSDISPIKSSYRTQVHQKPLSKSLPCKDGQHETRSMDLLAVVSAQVFLLFQLPAPQRLLHIPRAILAAHHEPDLAGWICRDGRIGVLNGWEDFSA